MTGFVNSVEIVSEDKTITKANVSIVSASLLMQEQGKERIYQNPQKTFSEILKNYDKIEIGKCEHVNDKIEEILYQHQMDDFTFLKLLAGKCGTALWITDEGNLSFGSLRHEKTISDTDSNVRKGVLEKRITSSHQKKEISILTMEQFPNGTTLHYQQETYVICQTEVHEEYDEVYFRYIGSTMPDHHSEILLSPITVSAKVTDNQDKDHLGRVQVEFTEFEDNAKNRTWIPWLSPYVGRTQGGVIMLPDVNDIIIIHIAETICCAIGTLRQKVLPDDCQDVKQKYFSMSKTCLILDEKHITAVQGEKIKTELTENAAVIQCDHAEISVKADAIQAQLPDSVLKLDKNSINAEQKNSKLSLDKSTISAENGSGKLKLEKSSAVLSGKSAKLSLSNGNTKLSGTSIALSQQAFSEL